MVWLHPPARRPSSARQQVQNLVRHFQQSAVLSEIKSNEEDSPVPREAVSLCNTLICQCVSISDTRWPMWHVCCRTAFANTRSFFFAVSLLDYRLTMLNQHRFGSVAGFYIFYFSPAPGGGMLLLSSRSMLGACQADAEKPFSGRETLVSSIN